MPKPSGTATISATSEVLSVPTINGAAPNCDPSGFQSCEVIKANPTLSRVSDEAIHNITPTPTISPRMTSADSTMMALNGASPCCSIRPSGDDCGRFIRNLLVADILIHSRYDAFVL